MKVVFTLLSIVLMSIVSGLSYAGPFGTQMGDQKDVFSDLKAVPQNKPGIEMYLTTNMPKRHSLFKEYLLIFGNNGLVSIGAFSNSFQNDKSAKHALVAYDNIKKQLTEKYGTSKSLEFFISDGIWKKDSEFAMSLKQNERQHACEWTQNLPDDLKLIRLMIIGESSSSVKIAILYEYTNIDAANAIKEKIEKDSL